MSPDRYGDTETGEHHCRNGWLIPPDSDEPRLCPVCRPRPRTPTERPPSARAQQAIENER